MWSRVELGLDRGQRVQRFLHTERWTFASLGAHVLALFCVTLMPPKSSALALDMLSEDARYARYLAAPVEIDPPTFLNAGDSAEADGARATDTEGAAGAPDAPRKRARASGRQAPSFSPEVARTEARNAGILGVLPRAAAGGIEVEGSAFNAIVDPSEYALAGVTSGALGESFGFNGLGMRGTGRGGGGPALGTVGVGKLGSGLGTGTGYCGGSDTPCAGGFRGREASVPQLRSGTPEVHGSLAKEAIRRTIQRHLNEVRFCYTEGLRSTPELSGRVNVMFVISSAGVVQQATVVESQLQQPSVERCITEAVRRWSFPAPDGGGYVTVRYPFVFEQIGS